MTVELALALPHPAPRSPRRSMAQSERVFLMLPSPIIRGGEWTMIKHLAQLALTAIVLIPFIFVAMPATEAGEVRGSINVPKQVCDTYCYGSHYDLAVCETRFSGDPALGTCDWWGGDCNLYADSGVAQNSEKNNRNCPITTPSNYWTSDRGVHFNWCNQKMRHLIHPSQYPDPGGPTPQQGYNARQADLDNCPP